MRIGIDISQVAYGNTGVSNYLSNLVLSLLEGDKKNEFVLFFSSLRRELPVDFENKLSKYPNVRIRKIKIPPTALDLIWNKLHVLPIENFIGAIDFLITSDWSEPPVKAAQKATIIYDLIVFKHPEETDQKIISVQKRKLKWVKKESDFILCISESTKKDIENILGIEGSKIKVIYPGL
jgi:hypothetical protein